MCGDLRLTDTGKQAILMGWAAGGATLATSSSIDLRDRSGITQIVFNKEKNR